MKIIPVILSGGSGTRLWPLSRNQHPKQYLSLASKNTMLQETILRLNGLDNLADPIIICNAEHRFLVADQCQQIGVTNPTIFLEPIGRNTAPAIAAAAIHSLSLKGELLLLVLSADHVIQDIDSFFKAINIAVKHAKKGKLVTFGIVPNDVETGYGYIKSSKVNIDGAFTALKFVEKPDFQTAKLYIEHGDYLWNSGMFMFKADVLIDEFNKYSPSIAKLAVESVNKAKNDLDFIRLDKRSFEACPSDSIDYVIMEKSNKVVVVRLNAQWNDVGTWNALYNIGEKDAKGNVIKGDAITLDTINTYINANHHMIATIGVNNLIVVDTPDATLISSQKQAKEVKRIVETLQSKNRDESGLHRKVYRPWGWYDSIESGEYFQVKRLYVKPGAKLSLQMHQKRAEHWVVVKGQASVINGENVFTLNEGESTYIPVGQKHGLENKSSNPLEVIEVQSGTYLGEDDIVRFEDIYGRIKS